MTRFKNIKLQILIAGLMMFVGANASAAAPDCSLLHECYGGEGTVEAPFVIEFGGVATPEALKGREKEVLKYYEDGIKAFNATTSKFDSYGYNSIKGVPAGFVVLTDDMYKFPDDRMARELDKFASSTVKASLPFDISAVYHNFTNETIDGVSGGGAFAINGFSLAKNPSDHFAQYLFAHETGHILYALHSKHITCNKTDTIMVPAYTSSVIFEASDPSMPCGVQGETDNAERMSNQAKYWAGANHAKAIVGSVSLATEQSTVTEGDELNLVVTRDGDVSESAYVNILLDGVTSEQIDGIRLKGVYFKPSESIVKVPVKTLVDHDYPENEVVMNATLVYPIGLTTQEQEPVQVSIANVDDFAGGILNLATTTLSVKEGEQAKVVINRIDGDDGELKMTLLADNELGESIVPFRQDVVFADGEIQKVVSIPTIDDEVYDAKKVVKITAIGDVGQNNQATLTIAENDPIPSSGVAEFALDNTTMTEDGLINVLVKRGDGSYSELSVNIIVNQLSGNATLSAPSAIVFEDGETEKMVTLQASDDGVDGGDSMFSMELTGDVGERTYLLVEVKNKKLEPKPDPKPEPKPEPKPDPKPEPKPDPKPEPKPDPKPEPKPDPKPEPSEDSSGGSMGGVFILGLAGALVIRRKTGL